MKCMKSHIHMRESGTRNLAQQVLRQRLDATSRRQQPALFFTRGMP